MPSARPYQCITLSFLLITSLVILSYFFAQFPLAPQGYNVYPSLASLGPETKAKDIYPAEYYPGGAYVSLPFGKVGVHFATHHFPAFLTVPIFPTPYSRSATGYSALKLARRYPVIYSRSRCLVQQSRLDCSHSWPIHTFINLEGCGARSCIAWLPSTFVRYAYTCICLGTQESDHQ